MIIRIIFIVILSAFIALCLYVIVENALKRRSYKAKYQAVLQHVLGLDLPMYATCNVFANEEGLIFVAGNQEQRIPASQLKRIEYYTEHDMRGRAARELVKIGSLDGLVRNVPRANEKKDLYVLVINYEKEPGDVQVIGLVGDNPMHILDTFTQGTNKMYQLVTLVEEAAVSLELPPED